MQQKLACVLTGAVLLKKYLDIKDVALVDLFANAGKADRARGMSKAVHSVSVPG